MFFEDLDDLERAAAASARGEPPPVTYSIAGTWSGWHRAPMRWEQGCFVHEVTIGHEGYESFQVLLNGNWDTVFYPSIQDGSPWAKCKLRGPDKQGHYRNWTIGRPKEKLLWRNVAKTGERYLILVKVNAKGIATAVTWRRLEEGEGKAAELPGAEGPSAAGPAAGSLEWRPPATAQAGVEQVTGQERAGRGLWLVSEAQGDLELGDIVLLRPGDVVCGGRGLASRGGAVLRIEFVEAARLEAWRLAAAGRVAAAAPAEGSAGGAPAERAPGRGSASEAAVGDAAATTAEGHQEEGDLSIEVWRVPDVRGWGHIPAIRFRQPSSSLKVRLPRGKCVGDLKEAIRAGLPLGVALWGREGGDLADGRPLEPLLEEEGGRLFYELYHDVRIYRGGDSNLQWFMKVTVKASATLYDVRAALVSRYWHMYFDLQFVQEGADGSWTTCDEDEPVEGRTELLAVGGFMDELPAFEVDEEAEVHLWDGPYAGKRVRCRVEGSSDSGETYDLHILPTSEHDGAGGKSDSYFPRISSHLLRKIKSNPNADGGPMVKPLINREQAVKMLEELLAGYRSDDFQRRMEDLLAHYPDQTGFIPEVKFYTGYYAMRKQVLLSLQSAVLPKYGFSKYQGGTVMMVAAIKKFNGDAEIDRLGLAINEILQAMYEEKLT